MAISIELSGLSNGELAEKVAEARRELLNLRFRMATGQLDNSARISAVKKEIARMLTLLRSREIAEAEVYYEEGDDA